MQTINIPAETFEKLISRLDDLTREVKSIKAKLFDKEPPYGSKEWWEWSDKKAIEEIKAGKGVNFDSVEEAIKWLNS